MKKNTIKVFIAILITIVLCSGLIACSKEEEFDAAGYVKSVLDASYHAEYTDYATFRNLSEEEAKKEIEDGKNELIEREASTIDGMTEDGIARYAEICAQADMLAKYEVQGAEKQDDGSYVVTVSIEPSNVFQTLEQNSTDIATEKVNQGLDLSQSDVFTDLLVESIQRSIDQNVYGEAATITVAVMADDSGAYGVADAEMQTLQDALFPE